ncbi:hypothetical protein F5878DRAFT_641932 [Lentinula raphanica]|uniref:Uncharacterized protein n=1 Tax=Lentinula raphanica TaxID=153919 RepID=A0AA38UEM8_9AGAR|nr:hypothetical protein F5878DRAFT_641932 [Lentinula raphanica]
MLITLVDLNIYTRVFYIGVMICGLVWFKLMWNMIVLVFRSRYWLLGSLVLGPGVGVIAGYLTFYSSLHNDLRNPLPKAFVFATVAVGIWICIFSVVDLLVPWISTYLDMHIGVSLCNNYKLPFKWRQRFPSNLMEPEYFEAGAHLTSTSASYKPVSASINKECQWTWYRNQTYEFYRYVRDENTGLVQKMYDNPHLQSKMEKNIKLVASRKATPVSFEPLQTPPKYFMEGKALPIMDSGIYGPTKLQTSNFSSKDSQGITAWHYSQSPTDLEIPLPETPTPSKLGTIYIHRNTRDGGYQVWVWLVQGDREQWLPIDLSGPLVHHPEIPTRVLTMQTSTGNPSWVLHTPKFLKRFLMGIEIASIEPYFCQEIPATFTFHPSQARLPIQPPIRFWMNGDMPKTVCSQALILPLLLAHYQRHICFSKGNPKDHPSRNTWEQASLDLRSTGQIYE